MDTISVLVVDDHVAFADAVHARLAARTELRPVAVAYSLEQAIAALQIRRPDVVVADDQLSDGTGVDLADRARVISPGTRIVMLSAIDSPEAATRAVLHGVRVWLPKTIPPRRLVHAIQIAHAGRAWLPAAMLGPVLDALVECAKPSNGTPLARLSQRELEVLAALAEGRSRREVAADLHLSVNTIRSHVQNIIGKLEVHSTLEAVAAYNRADVQLSPAASTRDTLAR